MTNIFDEAAKPEGEFFKFDNVGDGIQGTYVDRYEGDSMYGAQTIIVLRDAAGTYHNVGVKHEGKPAEILRRDVDKAKFGEIVGFRLDKINPSKVPGYNPSKIIRFYHDPKIIDQAWLAEKGLAAPQAPTIGAPMEPQAPTPGVAPAAAQSVQAAVPTTAAPAPAPAPVASAPAPAAAPANDPNLGAIRTLALNKGLTSVNMSEAEQDAKIKEFTGLDYNNENNTQIIIKLSGYSA